MADLRESAEYIEIEGSKLVPTLAPRLGVGLGRAGLGLGCAINGNNTTIIYVAIEDNIILIDSDQSLNYPGVKHWAQP